MDKWLKKIPAKKPRIEDNTNNASTSEQQENGRADSSPTPSTSSSSATLRGKNNDDLIRSDKKSAKKIRNYQEDYLKYGFTSTIFNDEPRPKCILCLEILANDSMTPS